MLLFILSTISCSDSLTPNIEASSELEFPEPMTAALASSETGEVSGDGIFMLNWNGMNPHSRFSDDNEMLALAMAIGFDKEVQLQPPYHVSTVDMGTVTIRSAGNETIELAKQQSRFSADQLVYSSKHFGPFQQTASLTYVAGGEYSIETSGSGDFPALRLSITAPDKQVAILSPSETHLQAHSGDLELKWEAMSSKPVGIHIRPALNPREGQKPGQFTRESSEMIILEDQDGAHTIPEEIITSVAEASGSNAVHISVGQLHVNDIETDGKIYRVIMRTADHLLVRLN